MTRIEAKLARRCARDEARRIAKKATVGLPLPYRPLVKFMLFATFVAGAFVGFVGGLFAIAQKDRDEEWVAFKPSLENPFLQKPWTYTIKDGIEQPDPDLETSEPEDDTQP